MKMFLLFIIAMFSLPTLAHDHAGLNEVTDLSFMNGAIHARVTWLQGPRVGEESVMHLEWIDGTTHHPIEAPAPFTVNLYMPAMGHGSAPTQIQRELGADGQPLIGVYNVYNVYFLMGGDWDLNINLGLSNGTFEVQKMLIHFEDDGGHHH